MAPRLYADCWYLDSRLNPERRLTSPTSGLRGSRQQGPQIGSIYSAFPTHGIARYKSLRLVVDEVRRLGCRASFHNDQLLKFVLFTQIRLDSIIRELRKDPPLLLSDISSRVDNILACSICYECTSPEVEDSVLCKNHLSVVRDLVNSDQYKTKSLNVPPSKTIEFFIPAENRDRTLVKKQLALLRQYSDHHIWKMDAEGVENTCLGFAAIPSEFGIVNGRRRSRKEASATFLLRYP